METIKIIQILIYTTIGGISLVSLLTYSISRYYYRPYGKNSAKEILYDYYGFNNNVNTRIDTLDFNNYKVSDNVVKDKKGVIIAIANRNNLPPEAEEREQIIKEIHYYRKRAEQAYVAFEIEFKDKSYIDAFRSTGGDSLHVYYNKYVTDHGEAIKSWLPMRVLKYIGTFLKRKRGNRANYYFYGEIFSPTEIEQNLDRE